MMSRGGVVKRRKVHREKHGRSCHACRASHIACDGCRPCSSCAMKGRECFDFDKNLLTEKNTSKSTKHMSQELEEARRQLEDYKKRTEILQSMLTALHGKDNVQDVLNQFENPVPRNEFEFSFWQLPDRKPVLMYSPTTLFAVGCNQAFRSLSAFSLPAMKDKYFVFDMIPEGFRDTHTLLCQWVLGSTVTLVRLHVLVEFKGAELCTILSVHFERSFVWAEFELVDYFSDEFTIDDVVVPPTFSVPFTGSKNMPKPQDNSASMMHRFFSIIEKKAKPVYSDSIVKQRIKLEELKERSGIYSSPDQQMTQQVRLKPVELSDQEMQLVMTRLPRTDTATRYILSNNI